MFFFLTKFAYIETSNQNLEFRSCQEDFSRCYLSCVTTRRQVITDNESFRIENEEILNCPVKFPKLTLPSRGNSSGPSSCFWRQSGSYRDIVRILKNNYCRSGKLWVFRKYFAWSQTAQTVKCGWEGSFKLVSGFPIESILQWNFLPFIFNILVFLLIIFFLLIFFVFCNSLLTVYPSLSGIGYETLSLAEASKKLESCLYPEQWSLLILQDLRTYKLYIY